MNCDGLGHIRDWADKLVVVRVQVVIEMLGIRITTVDPVNIHGD